MSEFSARDEQLCKAGASDDPEPWPEQADRERQHLETVVAMAALHPGERRWRRRNKERREDLDDEYKRVLISAVHRAGVLPAVYEEPRVLSPLADEFEDVLSAQLRPLETAYVLLAAMLSLTATGMVYSRRELSWPLPPALLAAGTVIAVALVYIGFVRHSMIVAGEATARRLARLTLPALHSAAVLLNDTFVARSVIYGEEERKMLQEFFSCVPGITGLPLWHRLLGQYHLAQAWGALPVHLHCSPQTGDFASLREVEPAYRGVMLKLGLACRHLEQAIAKRNDDPVASLALAGAHDAMAAATGKRAQPEAAECAAEEIRAATGRDSRIAQLREHRWLWPRDPGPLTELARMPEDE